MSLELLGSVEIGLDPSGFGSMLQNAGSIAEQNQIAIEAAIHGAAF